MLRKCGTDYGIISKCSDNTAGLDVYEWSKENGGNINQWNYWEGGCQLWSITPVYPTVSDGSYMVRNVDSGLYLFDKNGSCVQSDIYRISFEYDPSGAPPYNVNDQIWTFNKNSDGSYFIKNQKGKAISSDSALHLSVMKFTGSDNQRFNVICNKDGSYSIIQSQKHIGTENNSKNFE